MYDRRFPFGRGMSFTLRMFAIPDDVPNIASMNSEASAIIANGGPLRGTFNALADALDSSSIAIRDVPYLTREGQMENSQSYKTQGHRTILDIGYLSPLWLS